MATRKIPDPGSGDRAQRSGSGPARLQPHHQIPPVHSASAPEPGIRERLAGCWRLVGYQVYAADGGESDRPLGDDPLGTILYTPDGYMSAQLARPGPYEDDDEPNAYYIAYSGSYDVDEQAKTVAHHVQVSVIPSWLGTTQIRQVQFGGTDTLELSASEPRRRDGVMCTTSISWSRQPPVGHNMRPDADLIDLPVRAATPGPH